MSKVYDIQVRDKDGWWTFDSVEGLEAAKERAKAEREEMERGEMPRREIRHVRQPT